MFTCSTNACVLWWKTKRRKNSPDSLRVNQESFIPNKCHSCFAVVNEKCSTFALPTFHRACAAIVTCFMLVYHCSTSLLHFYEFHFIGGKNVNYKIVLKRGASCTAWWGDAVMWEVLGRMTYAITIKQIWEKSRCSTLEIGRIDVRSFALNVKRSICEYSEFISGDGLGHVVTESLYAMKTFSLH